MSTTRSASGQTDGAESTPRTNRKAERFIRTLLTEWAYARAYRASLARSTAPTSPAKTPPPLMGIRGTTPRPKRYAVNNLLIKTQDEHPATGSPGRRACGVRNSRGASDARDARSRACAPEPQPFGS